MFINFLLSNLLIKKYIKIEDYVYNFILKSLISEVYKNIL